jgi:Secretion system C-terminal sorting domain
MLSRNLSFAVLPLVLLLVMQTSLVLATVIHVPDDAMTIQMALALTAEGDTVLIADGMYSEAITLENHGLTIASEFIVDSDTSHSRNTILTAPEGQRILTIDSTVTTSVNVVGLSFQNGDCLADHGFGGAINATDISLEISHCIFEQNRAQRGGAVSLTGGLLSVRNSVFNDNYGFSGGGAIVTRYNEFLFEENNFSNNICWCTGGSIRISESSGTVSSNSFVNNWCEDWGGAIYCYSGDDVVNTVTFENNLFENNIATSGSGMWILGVDTLTINNNEFIHNIASSVGNLYVQGAALCICRDNIEVDIYENEFYYNISENRASVATFSSPARFYRNLLFRNYGNVEYTITTYVGGGNLATNVELYDNLFFQNCKYNADHEQNYGGISVRNSGTVTALHNDFYSNQPIAAGLPTALAGSLIVSNNYWGDPTGPYHETQNPEGLGDTVNVNTDCLPFSTAPFTSRWLRAPEPFDLIAPSEGEFIELETISFLWRAAADSTPHDTLRYTLEIADNPEFTDALLIDTDENTSATVDNLQWESAYYWRVAARDIYDLETYSTESRQFLVTAVEETQSPTAPSEWAIERIYPNPFNRTVQVVLEVPMRDEVKLVVYDLQGRLVGTLHHGSLTAGQHRFAWQPDVAAGMYFVRVMASDWQGIRRVVYLK